MTEHCHKDAVRLLRIHENSANLQSVSQAPVLPGLAAIRRLVDSVSRGEVRTPQSLSTAHINDVRIGRRNGKCTDRSRRLIIKNRCPSPPEIRGLPDAAIVGRYIEDAGLAGNTGRRHGATAAKRSDHPPAHALVQCRTELLPHSDCHQECIKASLSV